jgi:hypothetical protein
MALKKFRIRINAPLSRQPLVKGERLVRNEVSAAMLSGLRHRDKRWPERRRTVHATRPLITMTGLPQSAQVQNSCDKVGRVGKPTQPPKKMDDRFSTNWWGISVVILIRTDTTLLSGPQGRDGTSLRKPGTVFNFVHDGGTDRCPVKIWAAARTRAAADRNFAVDDIRDAS